MNSGLRIAGSAIFDRFGVLRTEPCGRLFDLQEATDSYRQYKDRLAEQRIAEVIETTLTKRYPEGSDSYSVARRVIQRAGDMEADSKERGMNKPKWLRGGKVAMIRRMEQIRHEQQRQQATPSPAPRPEPVPARTASPQQAAATSGAEVMVVCQSCHCFEVVPAGAKRTCGQCGGAMTLAADLLKTSAAGDAIRISLSLR